jgi:hypothetical protein
MAKNDNDKGQFFVCTDDPSGDVLSLQAAIDEAKVEAIENGENMAIYRLVARVSLGEPPVIVENV